MDTQPRPPETWATPRLLRLTGTEQSAGKPSSIVETTYLPYFQSGPS